MSIISTGIKWGSKFAQKVFGFGKVASKSRELVPYVAGAASTASKTGKIAKYAKYAAGGLLVADAAGSIAGNVIGSAAGLNSIMDTEGYNINPANGYFANPGVMGNYADPMTGNFANPSVMGLDGNMFGFDEQCFMDNSLNFNNNQFGASSMGQQNGLMGMVMKFVGFIMNLFSGMFGGSY